jgi:hypothetical protein
VKIIFDEGTQAIYSAQEQAPQGVGGVVGHWLTDEEAEAEHQRLANAIPLARLTRDGWDINEDAFK